LPQATVKTYDSLTKTGTLVGDDGETTYEITPDGMDSSMFRFLRPGQRVTFELVDDKPMNLRIGIA
jgi:hypothetical protein